MISGLKYDNKNGKVQKENSGKKQMGAWKYTYEKY